MYIVCKFAQNLSKKVVSGLAGRVFNGISFREIFAKQKRNDFRNFAKKRSFSRNFVFRENVILAKISETKRSETKRSETKRSETKRSETKRSETKRSETKRSETKRSETKRSEMKRSKTKRNKRNEMH
jgi:hypothetical protein